MQVVFKFGCITTLGRVRPGDMMDLPRDEATYLIESGMCIEHRVALPQSFAGPVGISNTPAGPPFHRSSNAIDATGSSPQATPTSDKKLPTTNISAPDISARRRRGYG